jgi:hypothetical protein
MRDDFEAARLGRFDETIGALLRAGRALDVTKDENLIPAASEALDQVLRA